MNKLKELKKLLLKIKKCKACKYKNEPWFFWAENKVENLRYILYEYDEKRKVMFVGSRPSTGIFPSNTDFLFAKTLEKLGYSKEARKKSKNIHTFYTGCFITDLVKCRGKVDKIPYKYAKTCMERYFKKEIEIIEPHRIIPIGKEVKRLLNIFLKKEKELGKYRNRVTEWIYHYSYTGLGKKLECTNKNVLSQEFIEKYRNYISKRINSRKS